MLLLLFMPKKKKLAAARCAVAAALTLALLLATNFGAFHLMFGGRGLTAANLVPNRYLTFNVDTIVDYLAEDYQSGGNTVTGRYALLITGDGQFVVVHLPQRYLDDGDTIAAETYNRLYNSQAADKYFAVSGTVKAAPKEVVGKYADWFNSNAVYMYQSGLIKDFDQKTITYMDKVSQNGVITIEESKTAETYSDVVEGMASRSLRYLMRPRIVRKFVRVPPSQRCEM